MLICSRRRLRNSPQCADWRCGLPAYFEVATSGNWTDIWLRDAQHCGLHAMRSFVRKLRQDIDAVRNAILEPWSNGQVEGQINRLKMLKRAMYGRASVELLRARMMPLDCGFHRK